MSIKDVKGVKFFTTYTRPKTKGQEFDFNYTWQYYDEDTGELKTDSINQYEAIQSVSVPSVQSIVENFDEFGSLVVGREEGENIVDTTGLDNGDLPTVLRYLSSLQADILRLQKQMSEEAEGGSEVTEVGGEVTETQGDVGTGGDK